MAQRNPMNERNLGSGPAGQTRKSASSAKPIAAAAASVRIKGKPETSAEKKAAEQERKQKLAKKAAERQRKAARAEQRQRTTEAKLQLVRGGLQEDGQEDGEDSVVEETERAGQIKPAQLTRVESKEPTLNDIPGYRKWRRINWILTGVAVFFVLLSFWSMNASETNNVNVAFVVPSYVLLGATFIIEYVKIRPLVQEYRDKAAQVNKLSPKQAKHAEAERVQAEQMAQARKDEKAARKRGRQAKAQVETEEPAD